MSSSTSPEILSAEPVFQAPTCEEVVRWLQRKLDRHDIVDLEALLEEGGYTLGFGHFINVFKV